MLEGSTAIIFYIIAFVMILAAIGVATLKNIFHAALLLVLTLFCVAAVYILLSAEFLAAVQVLIYVGAVSVLLIFAVMLTAQLTNYNIKQSNEQSLPALLVSVCFIVVVIFAIVTNLKVGGFPLAENPEIGGSNTAALGELLMRDFILPFEVVSVLLLAALIGAIVIAKKDK
jgi:NADH-quinone oxidoreductase subunit J